MAKNKYTIFSIAYCIFVAFFYSLSKGDFVGGAYEAALSRMTDFQGPLLLYGNEMLHTQHPAYIALAKVAANTFPATVFSTLLALKIDFYITLAITMAFFRALALLVIFPWLRWVGAPRWCAFLMAPLLLGIFWGDIYRYIPWAIICGEITVSLFLLACGALLFRWYKVSLVLWFLQAWTHPSTFLSWSLLYIALWLHATGWLDKETIMKRVSADLTLAQARSSICVALMVIPVAIGGVVSLLEVTDVINMQAGPYYWDFVAARNMHSLFGGALDLARVPMGYLLMATSLFALSVPTAPVPERLRFINRLVACTGFAFYCIYLFYVETRLSVIANMLLPLRFEVLFLCFFLFNIFAVLFAKPEEYGNRSGRIVNPGVFCIACGFLIALFTIYGAERLLYLFPVLLFCSIFFMDLLFLKKVNITFNIWQAVGVSLFILFFWGSFYFLSPNTSSFLRDIKFFMTTPAWLWSIVIVAVFSCIIMRICSCIMLKRAPLAKICALIVLISMIYIYDKRLPHIYNYATAKKEMRLLWQGERATTVGSPWNEFLVWQRRNISPDEKILPYPALLLNLLGVPGVGVQNDTNAFSLYLPKEATLLAEQLAFIFNIDIADYARRGAKLYADSYLITREGWDYAKSIYLGSGSGSDACRQENPGKPCFQWIAEPITGWDGRAMAVSWPERVVFENAVIRVYAVRH